MPQNRYYVPESFAAGQHATLSGEEFHYCKNVMRSRVGEQVTLIDGQGKLGVAKIEAIDKEKAVLIVLEVHSEAYEEQRPYAPVLIQALLKPAHLEFAIEKTVELGVGAIWLFPAARSEKKEVSESYRKRLESIILSASKQCGRLYFPTLIIHKSIKNCVDGKNVYFGDPTSTTSLDQLQEAQASAVEAFIVGPEGGFTPDEVAFMKTKNAIGVRLHHNTLRAETAAIVAIAKLT